MKTLDDLFNELFKEIKQKEYIILTTKRCEVDVKDNTFVFMGTSWRLPQLFTMEFILTNDHIERCDDRYRKAEFDFKLNYN